MPWDKDSGQDLSNTVTQRMALNSTENLRKVLRFTETLTKTLNAKRLFKMPLNHTNSWNTPEILWTVVSHAEILKIFLKI